MSRKKDLRGTRAPAAPANWRSAAAWVFLLITYLLLRGNQVAVPIDRDEGAFGYIAQRLLHGELPYRDWSDLKPPGVFYIYTLAVAVFPPTSKGVHLFLLLWNFAVLLLVVSLGRALGGRRAGWWCGFFYALVSAAPSAQSFKAGVEMLAILPLAASVRLALAAPHAAGWRRVLCLAASGVLGALTCWTKQPMALSLLIIPPWYLARARPGPTQDGAAAGAGAASLGSLCRRLTRDALWWLAGGLLASVLICLPFILAGALEEMIYWSFTHPWLYARLASPNLLQVMGERLAPLAPELGAPLALAVAGAIWAAVRRRPKWWVGLLFLGLSFAGACHTAFLYPYYFAQVFPALALAAGAAVAAALEECARIWRGVAAAGIGLLAALAPLGLLLGLRHAYLFPRHPEQMSWAVIGAQDFEAAPELAGYLRQRTRPEDWIFIYGSEAQIAFMARRRLANPYVMIYPLTFPLPRHREFQERTWAFLQQTKPRYVLVPWNPISRAEQPATDPYFKQRFEPYVQEHYQIEAALFRTGMAQYQWVMQPTTALLKEKDAGLSYTVWRRKADH